MIRRPPRSTLTDTLFPYTTLFRSVGRDRDPALAARLGDDMRFPLVITGVQHGMLDVARGEELGQKFRLLDGNRAHQHRLAALARFLHSGGDGRELVVLVLVELVRSAEHTSELQSLMRLSYSVFCL